MDLVKTYLYITSPILTVNIKETTFVNLKKNGWYKDSRGSQSFQILNKRFNIEDKWYRVMIRFERSQDSTYTLNTPIPFIVAETETDDGVIFIDKKVHHGRKLKHTLGYVENGVPIELIDAVIQDLKDYVIYENGEGNNEL